MSLLPMFLLLLATGIAVTGITGYLIFGPLTFVQARDRGLKLGAHCFVPSFLCWIIGGRFRETKDSAITGLATPAQLLLWCFVIGSLGAALLLVPEIFD